MSYSKNLVTNLPCFVLVIAISDSWICQKGSIMKKLLVIPHETSRTGAPLLLLSILRRLRNCQDIETRLLLAQGGPLTDEFCELFPSLMGGNPETEAEIEEWLNWPDLIFTNSVPSHDLLKGRILRVPVLSNVLELDNNLLADRVRLHGAPIQKFVVASEAVRSNLVKNHGIDQTDTTICYGFAPDPSIPDLSREQICRQLDIPTDSYIVGSVGTLMRYKGPDIFVEVCKEITELSAVLGKSVHFAWIGGHSSYAGLPLKRMERSEQIALVAAAGLDASFHYIGEVINARQYISAFDVFVSAAREDPFPTVVLEAACERVPIVCFDAGGAKEFVENDGGIVIPAFDARAMAQAVITLLADSSLRARMVDKAAERVESEFNADKRIAAFIEAIDKELSSQVK
jgi:glycosyltransferase involved in cell wall biosynthesis